MEIKKRNRIIVVVVFFTALTLAVIILPVCFKSNSPYFNHFLYAFGLACMYLDIFVLAITLFFCIFLIIRRKSLKGERKPPTIEMILGSILIIFPLVGIGVLSHGFVDWYLLDSLSIIMMETVIPLILLLLPGIFLFIHGWYLRKKTEN